MLPSKHKKILITPFCISLLILSSTSCFAATHTYSYELNNEPGGSTTYRLRVSVTESLYDYYINQDHNLYNYDFSKFATPDALKPIADDLWTIYSNEEDFSNGVLMIVHQISYVESDPQKYPIETMIENEGDCDLLSIVAASIMKAGGLDVVLLLLEQYDHMLVGVHLPESPKDARSQVYFYDYEGKKYYVAETTGNEWKTGWRVGECPEILQRSTAKIITLINYEQTSPGQVSSSITIPDSSAIYMSLSKNFIVSQDESQNKVEITGSLSPSIAGEKITLYVSTIGSTMTEIATILTDTNGQYSHTWNSPSWGIYSIRANWSGDNEYSGTASNTFNLVILPFDLLLIGGILVILLTILISIKVSMRRKTSIKTESV
jgi:hypothetical protein